jgi:heme a synthase
VAFAIKLRTQENTRTLGHLLLATVSIQVVLGISNVWLQWPLTLAVLHNTGAAALLSVVVYTAMQLQQTKH